MDANMRCSCASVAWRVFGVMREAGMKPDRFTCSTLAKGVKQSTPAQLALLLDVLDLTASQCSTQLVNAIVEGVSEQATLLLSASSAQNSEDNIALMTSVLARARARGTATA